MEPENRIPTEGHLDPALINRYPHELSGGQNQRVGIARAMILQPKLVICDEAVSALDVSVQAQVVDLLIELQKEFGLAMIFISHDLAVVRQISHRVMVLYLGRLVELADGEGIFRHPRHPYTRALLDAVPVPDPIAPGGKLSLGGEMPSIISPPKGCAFHPRCRYANERCRVELPRARLVARLLRRLDAGLWPAGLATVKGRSALLMTDVVMPEMNGVELCRHIRSAPLPHYIYVILLTSRNADHDLLEGMDAGADDFLTKPVDFKELKNKIETLKK